jgi:hypothetical protein
MELLIAVSIFAVIAICLYSMFAGGIGIWKKGETSFKYKHSSFLALDSMGKELRNAINYSRPEQTAQPTGLEEGPALRFTGDEKTISFVTVISGNIAEVDYAFLTEGEKGMLTKRVVFQKDGFKEKQENQKPGIVLDDLKDCKFEYAYKSDKDESGVAWENSWAKDAADKEPRIPAGVRITLVFQEPGRQYEEILKKTVFIPTGTLEGPAK